MRAGFGEALSRAACFSEDSLWREDGCAGDEVGGRFIRRRENGRDRRGTIWVSGFHLDVELTLQKYVTPGILSMDSVHVCMML